MKVKINHLVEGAKEARGLVVVIDVFRAFSVETYLASMGAWQIRPVGTLEETYAWKNKDPGCLLIGERHGVMCEGFDYGNSPSQLQRERIVGKRMIHTTSAGTQGIVNAKYADEILTGCFVNASAIAKYIRQKDPDLVTIVAMGRNGMSRTKEDELCAGYIRFLLEGNSRNFSLPTVVNETQNLFEPDAEEKTDSVFIHSTEEVDRALAHLQFDGGEHFFDPAQSQVFPQEDFWMCIKRDQFDFVLKVEKDKDGFIAKRIDV